MLSLFMVIVGHCTDVCVCFFFQNPIEYCQLESSKNNYELAKNSIVFDWISAHLSGKKLNP